MNKRSDMWLAFLCLGLPFAYLPLYILLYKNESLAFFCFVLLQNHEKNDCPDYPVPCLQNCSQIILKKEVLFFFSQYCDSADHMDL